jgi:sporulation protein YlmC with PRC-barrel domain
MKRSVNNLVGYTISAKDGELGKVSEFYFDDLTWSIRYLVVNTGNWLSERKVLIPHAALGITDWKTRTSQVNLTMEQVRKSPDIETEKTVSRQNEIELFTHYALPVYWGEGFYATPIGMVPFTPIIDDKLIKEEGHSADKPHGDPHLRSTMKVKGYNIHATDGEIGHVEDYIIDDEKWNLCFLVVDTRNWLPGRKVLILPHWIKRIDWDESNVYVNLPKETIKNSPEYDPSKPIDENYEREFFHHYGANKNLL